MRKAEKEDREKVLQYLQKGIADCLYLYIDIMNYGIATEHMLVWVEEAQDEIEMVAMKYYDSFQIYSHRKAPNLISVVRLLQEFPVTMISGRRDIIEQLNKYIKNYDVTYGAVFLMNRFREIGSETRILTASEKDAVEIAELICADKEIGGHYTVNGLAEQLAKRINTGTGRSYIIREEGRVVAHSATYAETDGIAVVGGTVILQEYRNTPYYMLLSNYMLWKLDKENKMAYTFSISEKMIRYHSILHVRCGEYGKLVNRRRMI